MLTKLWIFLNHKMKIAAFVIADQKNIKFLENMKKSLRKFHTEKELPLIEITGKDLEERLLKDPNFFYRASPIIAKELMEEGYECVIKIDADSIITAPIDEAWSGEFDVKVVLNSNPREFKTFQYTVFDLNPITDYINCGFVVIKSKEFVDHWNTLCFSPHFGNYQMREQDLLNIIVHYGNYNVTLLDDGEGLWGLSSKGYWQDIVIKDDNLILPAQKDWFAIDKIIKVIHWAGANDPSKGNYRIKFQPEVIKYIDGILK